MFETFKNRSKELHEFFIWLETVVDGFDSFDENVLVQAKAIISWENESSIIHLIDAMKRTSMRARETSPDCDKAS